MIPELEFSVAVGRTEITTFRATSPALSTPKWACGLVHLVMGVVTLRAGVRAARLSFFRLLKNKGNMFKCPCLHCGIVIEFGEELADQTTSCPDCQQPTQLFRPGTSEHTNAAQAAYMAQKAKFKVVPNKLREDKVRRIGNIVMVLCFLFGFIGMIAGIAGLAIGDQYISISIIGITASILLLVLRIGYPHIFICAG